MSDVNKRLCICVYNHFHQWEKWHTNCICVAVSCYFIILMHLLNLRPHKNPGPAGLATAHLILRAFLLTMQA